LVSADTKVQIFGVDQHRSAPKILDFLYHINGIRSSHRHKNWLSVNTTNIFL
jgi:hypothetical protein